MNEILERILAASKDIGPPPKRYAVMASTVKGNQRLSDYDRFAQLPQESIGIGSAMPIIPSPFPITKTIQRTKIFKRLNRPPKIKTKDVQVPALILIDRSMFDIPSPIPTIHRMVGQGRNHREFCPEVLR